MIAVIVKSCTRFLREDAGQALAVVAVLLVVLLAFSGLVVDIGMAVLSQRILQTATDAAALAGAEMVPASSISGALITTDPIASANAYSALTGSSNHRPPLHSVTMVAGYPKLRCLQTLKTKGLACITVQVGSGSGTQTNAIQVQEQAIVPMYFLSLLGKQSLTISAMASAAIRGGSPRPSNVVVIIDSTLSMNATDADCGSITLMQCSLNGIQILLQSLSPCGVWQTSCGAATNGMVSNSFDRVSLFTFPNVTVGTAGIDSSCTTPFPAPTSQNGYFYQAPYGTFDMLPTKPYAGVPTALPYSFPASGAPYLGLNGNASDPTYQITPFSSDYRASDKATVLNSTSGLVKAVGGVAGCTGVLPPNYDGEYGTYYAGALYAAQAALVAQATLYPGSENVIIILSDGNSNAPQTNNGYPVMTAAPPSGGSYKTATNNGVYPSWYGECSQAVVAAQAASNAGTLVYSVAYGASQTGCATDTNPAMVPCGTMAGMASAPQYFFSDYLQSGSDSNCVASQPVTSLSGIFTAIAADLTEPRLVPDSTT